MMEYYWLILTSEMLNTSTYMYIYEIDKEGYKFIEKRENTTGEELEHGDEMKARSITSILRDAHVQVGYRMGALLRLIPLLSIHVTKKTQISTPFERGFA